MYFYPSALLLVNTVLTGFPFVFKRRRVSNAAPPGSCHTSRCFPFVILRFENAYQHIPARPIVSAGDVNTAVDIRGRASVRAVSIYSCITLEYVTRPPVSPQRF